MLAVSSYGLTLSTLFSPLRRLLMSFSSSLMLKGEQKAEDNGLGGSSLCQEILGSKTDVPVLHVGIFEQEHPAAS